MGSLILSLTFSSVRPPKKSWKKIFNLSGGEKTLSSLALVFALHHYKPTPLYFMDEIDAALDFKNVSIVACYIYVSVTKKAVSETVIVFELRWCVRGDSRRAVSFLNICLILDFCNKPLNPGGVVDNTMIPLNYISQLI